jgi:three-Cys-motif partner protein
MAKQWTLAYVDLFAGAGHAIIRKSKRIIPASPMLALDLPKSFSRYIYCELEDTNAAALELRAARHAQDRDVLVIRGDTNENVDQIVASVPEKSLTFCFADPFKLENLRFSTLETLASSRRVDFLVLLASGMDANRNPGYVTPTSTVVAQFTGATDWRARWPHEKLNFGDFVADEFGHSMKRLGYQYEGLPATKTIYNSKNAPLYRLAFFSRNELGMKFWYQSLKYTTGQQALF